MDEGLDLAITRKHRGSLLKGDRLLFHETVFPICSPSLKLSGRPEDLLRHSLLQEEHEYGVELDWGTWLDLVGPGRRARVNLVRFSTFNAAVAAAIAGAGIALGRSPLIDDELASGRLVRPFGRRQLPGSWDAVIRTRPGVQRDPHVAQLRDYLVGAAKAGGGHERRVPPVDSVGPAARHRV
jgi:LysR family transcriptional regulator, glycine cleavage system transcriptional activator